MELKPAHRQAIETLTRRTIAHATTGRRYANKQGLPLLLLFYYDQFGDLGTVKAAPLPGDRMPLWVQLQRHYAKVRTMAAAVLILNDGYSIASA